VSKGTRMAGEAKKYDGERALKPTVQLTDNGSSNRHLGFSQSTFAAAGRKLVYISDRNGAPNFYLMDLSSFESTQLTDATGIFAGGSSYLDNKREIFYWERDTIKSVNVDTLEERRIFSAGCQGGYLSASCDGRFIAFGAKCEQLPGFPADSHGRWAVMIVSAAEGTAFPAVDVPFPIGRVQFSPGDPDLLLFEWEGPLKDVPQRIWTTDTSGLTGGPLGRQNPNEARGGEFFSCSGERICYHGMRFHTRNNDGAYFVEETAYIFGLVRPDGSGETQFECHGPTGRCQMNYEEDILVCSQGGRADKSGQAVSLLRPVGRGGAVFDPLFYHGANSASEWLCPQFRPGDTEVIFTSDCGGHADIYLTSVKQ